jgi:F-type H+-transporting ATPase subunit b
MRRTILGILTLLAAAAPAAAQAAEQEGKGGLLTPSGGLMIWTIVVFLILLYILKRFAFKPITASVEARERALEAAVDAARRDREEAARVLEEHRKALEGARAEAQQVIVEARQTAEKVRADLLGQTHAEQRELLERARHEIEAERDRAIAQLRREAVDLAVVGASKVIEKNLDDASNRALVENFLASITPAAANG